MFFYSKTFLSVLQVPEYCIYSTVSERNENHSLENLFVKILILESESENSNNKKSIWIRKMNSDPQHWLRLPNLSALKRLNFCFSCFIELKWRLWKIVLSYCHFLTFFYWTLVSVLGRRSSRIAVQLRLHQQNYAVQCVPVSDSATLEKISFGRYRY
jgi:hypothetical protein